TVSVAKSSNGTGPSRNVREPTWSRWTGRSRYRNVASIGDSRALGAMTSLLLLARLDRSDHAAALEHRACHCLRPVHSGAARGAFSRMRTRTTVTSRPWVSGGQAAC